MIVKGVSCTNFVVYLMMIDVNENQVASTCINVNRVGHAYFQLSFFIDLLGFVSSFTALLSCFCGCKLALNYRVHTHCAF